jgi:outer membrane scaffolding protein for murein synthesis (MipA/OmpV family)
MLALAVGAGVLISHAPANAADLGYGGYKDGNPAADEWAITGLKVGAIAVIKPKYEGSDEYDIYGFPYLFPTFSGAPGFFSRIDARGLDDVRFRLIERDGFVAGPLAGYNLGRDEDDGDLLEGLGDVDGGVVAGGFVGYRLGPVLLDASFHNTFGDDGGYLIRLGAEIERPLRERLLLTARFGATYADDEYMDNYFGVSGSAIGLPDFDADGGFKDIYVELGLKAEIDERWSARTTLRYSHLIGDAADSPIVESEDQFQGLIGVTYKFGLER